MNIKELLLPVLIICFLSIQLFTSCTRNQLDKSEWDNQFPDQIANTSFKLVGRKQFILDSITSLAYPVIQYVDSLDKMVAFTAYNATFVIYDYNTTKLFKKIKLDNDKDRGVGFIPNSFSYSFNFISYDSILLYNSARASLFIVDSSSGVKRRYLVKPIDKSFTPPSTMTGEPLCYVNGEVYFSAYPGRDIYNTKAPIKKNAIVKLDLRSGKTGLDLSYPKQYVKANWGEHMFIFYKMFNPNTGEFIYSFPIDHYVYVSNIYSHKQTKYYAGSKYILHVNPISFETGRLKARGEDDVNNLIRQRTYARVLYDKYSNVYYRFVTNAMVDSLKGKSTPFTIIVLDKHFKKIGEREFDNTKYLQCSMFVSKEGLCLNRVDSNDDTLKYDVFKLVK